MSGKDGISYEKSGAHDQELEKRFPLAAGAENDGKVDKELHNNFKPVPIEDKAQDSQPTHQAVSPPGRGLTFTPKKK